MNPIPKEPSQETILAAAKIIAGQIIRGRGDSEDIVNIDEMANDIAACYSPRFDGYKLAKELEYQRYWNWDCDLSDADTLDGMRSQVRKLHEEFLRRWAVENPQQLLQVGTRVRTPQGEGVISEGPHQLYPLKYGVKVGKHTFLFWLDEVEAI